MGWDLVSTTDTGYKKYRDNYGNLRYIDNNGKFTNKQAWAGTQSRGAEEHSAHEVTPSEHFPDIQRKDRSDLESYDRMIDFVIDEPHESGYKIPIDKMQFAGRGYPIEDYPTDKRVDMLAEIVEENPGYDNYTWGVHTLTVDDGTITSSGYRYTTHQEKLSIIKGEFREIIGELFGVASSYGDAIITETICKCMDY